MFIDVVASTRMMHDAEISTISRLAEILDYVESLILSHGGEVHALSGDGIFAAFGSAIRAIECSVEVLWGKLKIKSQRVPLRIGVHLGDVYELSGQIRGHSINVAARLEALAEPGTICISSAIHQIVAHRFTLDFQPLGNVQLKNVPEPLGVFLVRQRVSEDHPSGKSTTSTPETPLIDPESPSVAILPLRFAGDSEMMFLAKGMSDDIAGFMARYRRLDIIANHSTLVATQESDTLSGIAKKLSARYIVQGSVFVQNGRLLANIMLMETDSQKLVWSERFDRQLDDVFFLLDEISQTSVAAMTVEIDHLERQRLQMRHPDSLDVYSNCVLGRDDLLSLDRQACSRALELFRRATAKSPNYARAHALISRAHGFRWKYRWVADRENALERSLEAANRAIDADGNDARGYAELGWVSLYKRNHDRAIEAYRHALALNPSNADILAEYADALKHDARPEEALHYFERAVRLNPCQSDHYLKDWAHTLFVMGDYESALNRVGQMRRPEIASRVHAASLSMLDRTKEAEAISQRLKRAPSYVAASDWVSMIPDRNPDYTAAFLEGMQKAGL